MLSDLCYAMSHSISLVRVLFTEIDIKRASHILS